MKKFKSGNTSDADRAAIRRAINDVVNNVYKIYVEDGTRTGNDDGSLTVITIFSRNFLTAAEKSWMKSAGFKFIGQSSKKWHDEDDDMGGVKYKMTNYEF
ncbi:MAG: hypothetical protein MPK62_01720 [Alphaproteobacteria bacterium]|nr:hypothetical protein [Alphaproteobacteria bacterium]MDA8029851.1 hypothetical protein [Alphaproteobacteria bacterium]